MFTDAQLASAAVSYKQSLLACYVNHNKADGLVLSQRVLLEIGDTIAEMNGRKIACEAVMAVYLALESETEVPEFRAVTAPEPPKPRFTEQRAWVRKHRVSLAVAATFAVIGMGPAILRLFL